MSEKDAGGPAFPYMPEIRTQITENMFSVKPGEEPGMTLRDYFIAHVGDENQAGDDSDYSDHAKAALVGRPCPSYTNDGPLAVFQFEAEFRAKWRVMRADAMLEARKS